MYAWTREIEGKEEVGDDERGPDQKEIPAVSVDVHRHFLGQDDSQGTRENMYDIMGQRDNFLR